MPKSAQVVRGNTPPYVPYPSFRTLIQDLHEHGPLPSRIDRSVLTRFSGITGTQLLTALRFLSLIDEHGHPTDRLNELVGSYETDAWPGRVSEMLREQYAPLFSLDLASASASHFSETFRKTFQGAESVQRKAVGFFLGAAKEAGIVISERVLEGRKPRPLNGSTSPRRRRSAATASPATVVNDSIETHDENAGWEDRLLAKFPALNPEWPPELQAKWFESFEKLMALRK